MLNQDRWARILPALALVFLSSIGYGQDSIPRISTFHSAQYRAGATSYAIAKDNRDILYFANEQGVLQYDGSFWKLIELPNFAGARSVLIDDSNRVIVGGSKDFGYLEPDSIGSLKFVSLLDRVNIEVDFTDIWQIVPLRNLVHFVAYEGIFTWHPEGNVDFKEIKDTYLYRIGDRIYSSSYEGSFGVFKGNQIEPLFDHMDIEEDVVFKIYPWAEDELALITSSSGMYTYNLETKDLQPTKNKLSQILIDKGFYDSRHLESKFFAFGTWDGGLIISDSTGRDVTVFDRSTGLSDNKVNGMILKGKDLWVATDNGISVVDRGELTSNRIIPPVTSIRKIVCNDIMVMFDGTFFKEDEGGKTILAQQDALPAREISYLENSLTFYFSAPNVSSFDKVTFSYFLEGHDQEWSPWKEDTKKEYTDLIGGDYTFYVKAKNQAGVEGPPTRYRFSIVTPWYISTPAILVYAATVALIIWLGYWYRTNTLRSMNAKLEAVIGQRTVELTQQQEELKKTNEELLLANSELDNFVYRSSHDFVAPLKSIRGLTEVAKMETGDNAQKKYLEMIGDQVSKLEEFIGNIIDYSANSYSGIKHEVIDFNRMIGDVIEDLKFYDNAENIKFEKQLIDINGSFNSDPQRLRIILNNLVTNSIKYSDKAKPDQFVRVEVRGKPEAVVIAVEDNGLGIPDDYQEKIYDMFFRASESSEGSGLGLYIVKETVAKMNGNISLKSTEGLGTRFEVELKYNNNGKKEG